MVTPRTSGRAAAVLAWLALLQPLATAQDCKPRLSGPQKLAHAPLNWQLLGRGVATLRTPHGLGAGILVADNWLIVHQPLVADVDPLDIEVSFRPAPTPRPAGRDLRMEGPISAAPVSTRYRVSEVVFGHADGESGLAFVRLEPNEGTAAGVAVGYLGARTRPYEPGESVQLIGLDQAGEFWLVPATPAEVRLAAGESAMLLPKSALPVHFTGVAAALAEGGCLVGVRAAENGEWTRMIPNRSIRLMMPDGGLALTDCGFREQAIESTPVARPRQPDQSFVRDSAGRNGSSPLPKYASISRVFDLRPPLRSGADSISSEPIAVDTPGDVPASETPGAPIPPESGPFPSPRVAPPSVVPSDDPPPPSDSPPDPGQPPAPNVPEPTTAVAMFAIALLAMGRARGCR